MNKLGFIITLLAIVMASCTNPSSKQSGNIQDSTSVDNTMIGTNNSEDDLGWVGSYEGILPCADCEGIETVIELKKNQTYHAHYKYLGHARDDEFSQDGSFTWSILGKVITLESKDETSQFQVDENELILLNAEGDIITGELVDRYVLKKKM